MNILLHTHSVEEIQPVIERSTQETEHHHTTQVSPRPPFFGLLLLHLLLTHSFLKAIHEHVTHAPKIHDQKVNAPISMSEFQGGQGVGHSHGARDAVVDERRS